MDTRNPYRTLFPLGCLSGVLGTALWIAYPRGWIPFYPAEAHAHLMVGSFLLSYALGFLWTAVPRFLQAPMPERRELSVLVVLMALAPVALLLRGTTPYYAFTLLSLLYTIRFARRRYRLRRSNPPPSFVFLLAGMLGATVSLAVLFLSAFVPMPALLAACARQFFLKGFLLCLVLGVGMKLLPVLLGWAPEPRPGQDPLEGRVEPSSWALLACLLAGVFLEAAGLAAGAGLAYAAALTGAGVLRMKLGRLPRSRSAVSLGAWASSHAVALSPLALVASPGFAVHFWHLVFISGLGLMTIFVSVRVVVAHSGRELARWERRPVLYVIGALVLLAAATRVTAPALGAERVLSHYAYAALTWILALLLWAFFFLKVTYGASPTGKAQL